MAANYNDLRMSFTEHLGELRTRLVRAGAAVMVSVVLCYILSDYIFAVLAQPLSPLAEQGIVDGGAGHELAEGVEDAAPASAPTWVVLNPLEYILVKIRIAGYGGLLMASPIILWQLCAFVFPGLRPVERRVVQIIIAGCSVLAIVGVGVAYFGVLPLVLPYLMNWIPANVEIQLRITETLSILIKLIVGFALAFQFPMAVLVLVYMGLLTPVTLKKSRKLVMVCMALVSAVLTPPDPVSMMIMLLPLFLLYEGSIWASYLVWRRDGQDADAAG